MFGYKNTTLVLCLVTKILLPAEVVLCLATKILLPAEVVLCSLSEYQKI